MHETDRLLIPPHYSTMTLNYAVLLLSLVTRYLRDDKNNALRIFMLSGSMQFSLSFQSNTNMQLF